MCILTGLDSFRHVFIEKMPQLEPELMSMTGLNLYTTLCGMAKTANASLSTPLDEEMVNGMDMLWGVALRARNPEVSFHSMQYLNNYYITCKSLIYVSIRSDFSIQGNSTHFKFWCSLLRLKHSTYNIIH